MCDAGLVKPMDMGTGGDERGDGDSGGTVLYEGQLSAAGDEFTGGMY